MTEGSGCDELGLTNWAFQIARSKRQKRGPVWRGSMSAAVLAKRNIAVDQWGFDGRKLGRAHVFLPEQPIDRTSSGCRQEHTLGIHPPISLLDRPSADKHRPRRAQRHQFMRI